MKKLLLAAACGLFSLVILAVYLFIDLERYAHDPFQPGASPRLVTVPAGQHLPATAGMLERQGIIHQPLKFKWYARLNNYDKGVKAGEYSLSAAMSPREILEVMTRGNVYLRQLTVPEGYTMHQIAALVEEAGITGRDDFLAAATDAGLARELGIPAPNFEGYLFPDTYFFAKGVKARNIVRKMVWRFNTEFTPEWEKQARKIGFSVHEVVILASMVEKETGAAGERALISSVFHNRLKRRMRLESDPTVIYGLSDFDGNLTRKDLKNPTPFNTYRIRGLPQGPIANPGGAALHAALFPARTGYLFFVSKKDRTHHFSTNLREHNRAVRKYQLGP